MLWTYNHRGKIIVEETDDNKNVIREIEIGKSPKWMYWWVGTDDEYTIVAISYRFWDSFDEIPMDEAIWAINGKYADYDEFVISQVKDLDFNLEKDFLRKNDIELRKIWHFKTGGKAKSVDELPELGQVPTQTNNLNKVMKL